jgi:homoserine kinase type II
MEFVSPVLLQEAATKFFDSELFQFSPTSGGINNFVFYCECNGKVYVLRVYNNGNATARVSYEHEVLRGLANISMTFQVPRPFPVLASPNVTHTTLSTGTQAAMFELIPGEAINLCCAKQFGKAAAELSVALYNVAVSPVHSSVIPPYYEIFEVHPAITRELFYATMESAEFDVARESTTFLCKELQWIESCLEGLHAAGLPVQLVHGDLVHNNVLCDLSSSTITGLIDFEFVAEDWRAMDLAISLSKYAGEEEVRSQVFEDFIEGYFSAFHQILSVASSSSTSQNDLDTTLSSIEKSGEPELCSGSEKCFTYQSYDSFRSLRMPLPYSDAELEAVPLLICLRLLSNVVYFVGRMVGREDTSATLISRMAVYVNRITWLKGNSTWIIETLKKHRYSE